MKKTKNKTKINEKNVTQRMKEEGQFMKSYTSKKEKKKKYNNVRQ